MYKKGYFKGKKITVMGLGLLGRGVGDVRFLAEDGADVIVTDLKTGKELQKSVDQLTDFPNVSFSLGGHKLEDFRDRDMILKGAGVPLQNIYINEARSHNIPVEMSAALFARLSPAKHIGITGTRGKSTVTQMIYEGLKAAGKSVYLGGNVRGVSTLAMLPMIESDDYVVMELDSWQLQGFGESKISPEFSVFTTIFRDHMNYYKDDMDLYIADKANIFLNQKEKDVFILGGQAEKEVLDRYPNHKDRARVIYALDKLREWELQLPGEHNVYNASLAYITLDSLGVNEETIRRAFETMKPIEGRLELLREYEGIKIYNDNNATTPDAAVAGLRAVGENSNVILIMGGADKGLDMSSLVTEMKQTVHRVLLLPGSGSDQLERDYNFSEEGIKRHKVYDIPDAIKQAVSLARKGDVILFSPAFASFGQFNNEYERNDLFVEEVKKLK